jgi:hypothetical protein
MAQGYAQWRNTLIVGMTLALGSGIALAGAQSPAGASVGTADIIEHEEDAVFEILEEEGVLSEEDATESEAPVIMASARTDNRLKVVVVVHGFGGGEPSSPPGRPCDFEAFIGYFIDKGWANTFDNGLSGLQTSCVRLLSGASLN